MAHPDLQANRTDEILATEFLSVRLDHFKRLALPVKKLVLEIVQFYLGKFYFMHDKAAAICSEIQESKSGKDEKLLSECYKAFLDFLPIGFRADIQGKNLFKQPNKGDAAAQYYVNELNEIIVANENIFKVNEFGLTQADHLRIAMLDLEKAINDDTSEDNQPTI